MAKIIKIVMLVVIILLVVLAAVADLQPVTAMLNGLHLALYLRLAALLGLLIVLLMAWGYRSRFLTTQKYRRADHVLAEAEATAKRKERAAMLLEEKLKAQYAQQAVRHKEQIDQLAAEHHKELAALKMQNLQLKEGAGKLLRALKKHTGQATDKPLSHSGSPQG